MFDGWTVCGWLPKCPIKKHELLRIQIATVFTSHFLRYSCLQVGLPCHIYSRFKVNCKTLKSIWAADQRTYVYSCSLTFDFQRELMILYNLFFPKVSYSLPYTEPVGSKDCCWNFIPYSCLLVDLYSPLYPQGPMQVYALLSQNYIELPTQKIFLFLCFAVFLLYIKIPGKKR